MKKVVTILLCISLLIITATSFSANAENTGNDFSLFIMETESASDFGFADYKFVDENGNSVKNNNRDDFLPSNKKMRLFSFLPEKYDARVEGYITDVKYQGESGNCWAFSTLSALETDSIKNSYDTLGNADYSEAHLSWFSGRSLTDNSEDPTYGDGINYDSPYSVGGNWLTVTAPLARWNGVAKETDYPFNPYDITQMTGYPEEKRYDTGSGIVLNSSEVMTDMDDTKQWIYDHGSVTAAFYYDEPYYNESTASYYMNTESGSINHQITIVGWDDNYPAENFNSVIMPDNNGAWICKNSWSKYWGVDGYFYISYYDMNITYFAGFTSKQVNESSNNYTYNGTGYRVYFNNSSPVQTANVFTAKGCEKLTSISIYTLTQSSDVTIYIYKDLKNNYRYPNQGTLALSMETFIPREGYHTIEFDEEIQLSPGSIFSVIVECVSQSGVSYIPFEYNQSGVVYSAKKGESFVNIGRNATTWIDNTQRGWGNLYIQAFTENCHSYKTEINESTCKTAGYEKTYCEFCGNVINEITYAFAEHSYSDWTDFERDSDGNSVSKKICTECGNTIVKTNRQGNTVGFSEFFRLIFNLFIKIFRII